MPQPEPPPRPCPRGRSSACPSSKGVILPGKSGARGEGHDVPAGCSRQLPLGRLLILDLRANDTGGVPAAGPRGPGREGPRAPAEEVVLQARVEVLQARVVVLPVVCNGHGRRSPLPTRLPAPGRPLRPGYLLVCHVNERWSRLASEHGRHGGH